LGLNRDTGAEGQSRLNSTRPPVRGLTISDRDSRNVLAFDLRDILGLLGDKGLTSTWLLEGVEAVGGEAADALHKFSDAGQPVPGEQLRTLADNVSQTIDGKFSAFLDASQVPWIRIRAVDSSAFDVITADTDVYKAIKSRFSRVVELFNVDDL
jgi:hypothetical protein